MPESVDRGRVLVTRPPEDAAPLAKALRSRGFQVLLEPLLTIVPKQGVEKDLDLAGVQALLFTSANGVRVFAGLSPERGLPVFVVGDASARTARKAGFAKVESAAGDVETLAALVRARLQPSSGALLHPAARQRAGDLKQMLESEGFEVRRPIVYEARVAERLSDRLQSLLLAGKIDYALFFSPRTAATFVTLIEGADCAKSLEATHAICLSGAVSAKLERLAWGGVTIAEAPNQDALLARLEESCGQKDG